ncbi:hypothetical protein lerEdw1_004112 [Lerista edwardsae]|nr:hypothetical protein lerEdw1_004112 [Lerista edwardsae]
MATDPAGPGPDLAMAHHKVKPTLIVFETEPGTVVSKPEYFYILCRFLVRFKQSNITVKVVETANQGKAPIFKKKGSRRMEVLVH